jgi:hypothetical protein
MHMLYGKVLVEVLSVFGGVAMIRYDSGTIGQCYFNELKACE